jgi:hypothetical protein
VDTVSVLALVPSIAEPDASERALRSVTWAMAARTLTLTWPERWEEVLDVARAVMPLPDEGYDDVRHLADITAEELQPIADDDPRDEEDVKVGRWVTFSGDSLRLVIEAATGTRPPDVDVMWVIPFWAECISAGIDALRERLDELEAAYPELAP